MKKLAFLFYAAALFGAVLSVPVDPDQAVEEQEPAAPINSIEPSSLSIPKTDMADILTDEEKEDGYQNITLTLIPTPPSFLFDYSKGPWAYSIDKKFVSFFESLRGMVTKSGYDKAKYMAAKDTLKADFAVLKELLSTPELYSAAQPGVKEVFNTTSYFYSLMRYHEALLLKDEEHEFDKHDAKCVTLFIKQLEFEISLLGFLKFDGSFKPDLDNGDPVQNLQTVKDRARELELQLGRLFFEKTQVFDFTMRAFSRIKEHLYKLESFVRTSASEMTSKSISAELMSLTGSVTVGSGTASVSEALASLSESLLSVSETEALSETGSLPDSVLPSISETAAETGMSPEATESNSVEDLASTLEELAGTETSAVAPAVASALDPVSDTLMDPAGIANAAGSGVLEDAENLADSVTTSLNTRRSLDEVTEGNATDPEIVSTMLKSYEEIQNLAARLDSLIDKAKTMDFSQLEEEIKATKQEFETTQLHAIRWDKLVMPEVTHFHALMKQNLAKLDEVNAIFTDRNQLASGELIKGLMQRDISGLPGTPEPRKSAVEPKRN